MLLDVRRPRQVTTGRTQSYRMILRLTPTGGEDVALFLCSHEGSIVHFERIVEPHELQKITTDPSKPVFRTDTVDVLVAAQGIADNMLAVIQADLKAYLVAKGLPNGTTKLSGASA